MTKYLGDMEDEDLIMFVLEHLKDHKAPQKLVEGLEPVRWIHFDEILPYMLTLSTYFAVGLGRRSSRSCC